MLMIQKGHVKKPMTIKPSSSAIKGIGCFRDKSTNTTIETKLEIEPYAERMAQKLRPDNVLRRETTKRLA